MGVERINNLMRMVRRCVRMFMRSDLDHLWHCCGCGRTHDIADIDLILDKYCPKDEPVYCDNCIALALVKIDCNKRAA